MQNKYLLCTPKGGLADNIKVIDKCINYCISSQRTLIVDTLNGALGINFSEYFSIIQNRYRGELVKLIIDVNQDLFDHLNGLSVFPGEFKGRLGKIEIVGKWVEGQYVYCDTLTNKITNFDFSKQYDEDVLYHNWYGQDGSFDCLDLFIFNTNLSKELKSMLQKLPPIYDGLHIRHTDKKVDYKNYFSEIKDRVAKINLLICTDSLQVIDYAKSFFIDTNLLTLNLPTNTNEEPLHNFGTIYKYNLNKKQLHLNMFADLIGLANSENLFFPNNSIMTGPNNTLLLNGSASGFSRLAEFLHTGNRAKNLMQNPNA
jgi:hypothetical protein